MKKNRYILSLLIALLLLYFSLPKFSLFAEGLEGMFTVSWMSFALLVIAGNLSAILYESKRQKARKIGIQNKKRIRYFGS